MSNPTRASMRSVSALHAKMKANLASDDCDFSGSVCLTRAKLHKIVIETAGNELLHPRAVRAWKEHSCSRVLGYPDEPADMWSPR